MNLFRFDGLVDAAFFDKMSNQWREEQNRCQREIDRHRSAEQSYMDEGVQILELARNAPQAVRAAGTAPETPLAQLRTIELG